MIALSLPEIIVAWFLRFVVRPILGPPFPVETQRFWLTVTSLLSQPPLGIRRTKVSLGGVDSVMFAPKGVSATGLPETPVVLYLHGGAFVTGNQHTHAGIAGYLARELGSVVHVLIYGLAPEQPYPAGRQDVLAAYNALIELGVEPRRIVVAGDSAGGAMVADLLFDLAQAQQEQPAGGIMLSPATGLDTERPAGAGRKDTLVRRDWATTSVAAYRRDTSDVENRILDRYPAVLRTFPPVYLQYSHDELLASESMRFGDDLRAAGVRTEIHADKGAFHILALLPGVMKRARTSIANIATFSRRCVARAGERDFAARETPASSPRETAS